MAFSVTSADLYLFGPGQSFFKDSTGVLMSAEVDACLLATLGELATKISTRAGGPPSEWSFTDPAGEAAAKKDVCTVMASDFALDKGLTLPGDGADPQWVAKAAAVRERWERMGSPPRNANHLPLYSGLVDATPGYIEGRSRGWSFPAAQSEVEA